MNVGDLKRIIGSLPDDMEVIETRYSDYESMNEKSWEVVKAVQTNNGWLMRSHRTMSPENQANAQKCLHFGGN